MDLLTNARPPRRDQFLPNNYLFLCCTSQTEDLNNTVYRTNKRAVYATTRLCARGTLCVASNVLQCLRRKTATVRRGLSSQPRDCTGTLCGDVVERGMYHAGTYPRSPSSPLAYRRDLWCGSLVIYYLKTSCTANGGWTRRETVAWWASR